VLPSARLLVLLCGRTGKAVCGARLACYYVNLGHILHLVSRWPVLDAHVSTGEAVTLQGGRGLFLGGGGAATRLPDLGGLAAQVSQ
jgi:hypothetical protein